MPVGAGSSKFEMTELLREFASLSSSAFYPIMFPTAPVLGCCFVFNLRLVLKRPIAISMCEWLFRIAIQECDWLSLYSGEIRSF
jgi:hypothetical protein